MVEYFSLKRDLANPAFLFTLGFFIASLILSFFIQKWVVSLHWTSFWIVVVGNLGVFCGAYSCFKLCRTGKEIRIDDGHCFSAKFVSLNGLIFLFCLQIVTYLLRVYLLKQYYGGSISSALAAHTVAIKFDSGDRWHAPFVVYFLYKMSGLVGFVCAFLLPYYLMFKNVPYKYKFWLCANFVLCLVGSLLSSGRTNMLCLLVSFFSFYIVTMNLRNKKIKLNVVLKWVSVALAFLLSFQILGYVIGRNESDRTWFDEVGIYCGAELQNLDDFIEGPKFQKKDNLYGVLTFGLFYNKFGHLLGIDQLKTDSRDYHLFNSRNNNTLGNVNTAFQHYWYDFGTVGTFILCSFIGFFMQALYNLVVCSKSFWIQGRMPPYLFAYSIMVSPTFMSFFSEKFFETFLEFFDYSFWVIYILLYILLYKKFVVRMPSFSNLIRRVL